MSIQKLNPRFIVLVLFVVIIAAMRIPDAASYAPWSHITPIGAMCLFSGTYFSKKWKALLFPLLSLFISDILINTLVFKGKYGIMYNGWYWIYGIFILLTFLGKWIIKKVTLTNVLIAAIATPLTHWLLADLIVWLGNGTDLRTGQPLSKDLQGLLQCYYQGLPFMKSFAMGTVLYSAIMFGGFEWLQKRNKVLQVAA
jgi:hypothetical protein